MDNEPLITVVVPVYNVEKYINKCIDSIINQTYKNLEIILVDDGSKDECGKICDDYAKKDNRILVIHKENGGLSDARNKGLDIAKGRFIYLVDSDDYIEDDTIEYLYGLIEKYDADIAIGNMIYTCNSNKTCIEKKEKDYKKEKIYDVENGLEAMLYSKEFTNSACDKLYKKVLFDNIRFPLGKLYEDLGTTYKLLAKSKKTVKGYRPTYYYLINRSNSIRNHKFNIKRMDALVFSEEILDYINNKYPNIVKAAVARLYMECILILLEIPNNHQYKNENNKIKKYLRQYRIDVLINDKVSIKQKVLFVFAMFGRIPLRILYKTKRKLNK